MRQRLQAAVAAVALALTALVVAAPAHADVTICEKYGSTAIQGGRYIVQNNVWGANTRQCINVTGTGFSVTEAAHDNPTDGAPAGYPSIYAGCHYANCTSGSELPMRADDPRFATIQTSVSMRYPSGGTYNAAYDLWFDPTPRTDGQNTGAEIMIWLNRVGPIQPIGSRVGTANLLGTTWEVWYGNIGWNVVSYVRSSPTNSLAFPVSTFYNDAVSRGYAQRSWYLTSVQAGFEPWKGQAGLAVDSFSYTVGGGDDGGGDDGGDDGDAACRVGYSATDWGGGNGFSGSVTITNTGGTAIDGWELVWTFPAGQRVTQTWNASYDQQGATVRVTNASYNGNVPPGGQVTFGFNGTHSGSNPAPTAFTLNGVACATA